MKIPQAYFDKVRAYFNGSIARTWLWFQTENNAFSGLTPLETIRRGKGKKVMDFINTAEGFKP
jgi:hypothetical protein